jgi:hypothetical protein
VIPLDTHVAFLGHALRMTRRKSPDLVMALEITRFLLRADPDDPLRFDWPLSRLGILGICTHRAIKSKCGSCPVNQSCRLGRKYSGVL